VTETVDKPAANSGGGIANLKPFPKGKSGNPNGRPKKIVEVAKVAEDNSIKAIQKMAKLLDSADDRVALAAAQALLDRSMGKPKQSVEMKADVTNHGSEPVSDTAQWIEDTLRARADRKTAEPMPH
jgi:hypothetical protein